MSGDLGAAYPGDHARPDVNSVEVAALLEAVGKSVSTSVYSAGEPFEPATGVDAILFKFQLPTWRADLIEMDRIQSLHPELPVLAFGAVLSYLPGITEDMSIMGDATQALGSVWPNVSLRVGYAYRLFPLDSYRDDAGVLTVHLHASRGCARTCRYCPYIRIQGRWSARDLSDFKVDLEDLMDLKVNRIQFRDQDFASDPTHALAVANAIAEVGSGKITYSVEGNLDRFTPEVMSRMVDSGCDEVIVGLESSDPVVLKSARRRILTNTEELVEHVSSAGPRVRGLFMVGLPGDNWARVGATVRRAIELPLHAAQFNVYAPLPGEKFGPAEVVKVEDFVANSNNFRYRTCEAMTAMEVRLAAGLAYRAFTAHRAGDASYRDLLRRIDERAEGTLSC